MAVNDPIKYRQTYNLQNKIYVEADYDNIVVIDPNKVLNDKDEVVDRLVQQENLVMYANLETKIIPRTKLAVGDSFDSPVNNQTIATLSNGDDDLKLNFLKPKGKKVLDTSWSDDFTGRGSRQFNSPNQNATNVTGPDGNQKVVSKILNYEDTQTLGITDINLKVPPKGGVYEVKMTLIDVRGRTLFEQGENSLYSVFFNYPYPEFILTLKGFYGKAVRYRLALLNFNARFLPETGNFEITLDFKGRNSAIMTDSIIAFCKHLPKMFPTTIDTPKNKSNGTGSGSDKTKLTPTNTTLGLIKLREVYQIYKSKGLIDDVFPSGDNGTEPITLESFMMRANNLEKILQERIDKTADFDVLNDVEDYQKTINDFNTNIYYNTLNNFLDITERLVYEDKIYYPYKESLSPTQRKTEEAKLKGEFDSLLQRLKENESFGEGKSYTLPNKQKFASDITVDLNFNDLIKLIDYNSSGIDITKTFEVNFGRTPSQDELNKYVSEFKEFNSPTQKVIDSTGKLVDNLPTFYTFGELPNKVDQYANNSFLFKLQKINSDLKLKREIIEKSITDELANMIVNSKDGLGFIPTIRNVFAVLFGGLDAFYRLMDDVHTNAWNVRKDPLRLRSIIPPEKINVGTDSVGVVSTSNPNNDVNIVYPWPTYFEKERTQNKSEQYIIKYPGDVNSIKSTQAYINSLWPEVAFTEAFLTASLQKNTPVDNLGENNEKQNTNFMPVTAVEFPFGVFPYTDKTDYNFLYEIYERAYLSTHYANINRGDYKTEQIDKIISNIDAENIINALSQSPDPFLNNILKNIVPNYLNYIDTLRTISSNGTGEYWTKFKSAIYNIGYIDNYLKSNYNKVYSIDTINSNTPTEDMANNIGGNIQDIEKFRNFINNTKSAKSYFLDTYPFNNVAWIKNNLQDGDGVSTVEDFYKTQTLLFTDSKKTISRLNYTNSYQNINLFTNKYGFDNYTQVYLTDPNTNTPISSRTTLKNYFTNRVLKNQYLTESFIDYGVNYSGNVQTIQTTSLLNTPYFINALQTGVEKQKNGIDNPYVTLGYLYLNSLPLITTKEKIKNTENGQEPTELDYLASTFNKFSAIHRLPYAWVLKYGSIWHRYKRYVEDQVDILDDVWKDFNYLENYDPATSASTTSYSGTWVGNIVLQSSETIPASNIINDVVTMGFYPKVINDVYRYFYNRDLTILQNPTPDNFNFEFITNGLSVGNTYNKFFASGFSETQPLRQITIKNYYQYFDSPNESFENFLLVPSMGGLQINQTEYECFNDNDKITKEIFNNSAVYNGSVRSLWAAPNFGYFDNSLIRKPSYNEYLKKVTNTSNKKQNSFDLLNNQSSYSKIDEIFAIFEPNILDEFEKLFLGFCSQTPTSSDLILSGEDKVSDVKNKRLFSQMEKLFLLPQNSVTLSNSEIQRGKQLAEAQIKNFLVNVKEFLEFDCILKMGNPGNFDRRTFNYFTFDPNIKPIGFPDIPVLPKNTPILPGDGVLTGPSSLITSQANYPEEWKALKIYVGEFFDPKIEYTNTGSTITDFFIDNDVDFTVTNIETLYPLIRLYAKEKLNAINNGGVYTKENFRQSIKEYVVQQENLNLDVLTFTLRYLNSNLQESKITTETVDSSVSGNLIKLDHYNMFKNINDKWIAGSDFTNTTIFENFLFLDKANRDIGDLITISIDDIKKYLTDPNKNYGSLVSSILRDNGFDFHDLPSYINFYGLQDAIQNGKPQQFEIPNSTFGTFLDVDYIDSAPKYVCTYRGINSQYPASNNPNVKFADDAFDLRKYDNPCSTTYGEKDNFSLINKVVGFTVDYGIQNQNMFRSMSVDMGEKGTTAESTKATVQLGESAAGNKVAQQAYPMYTIYRSRSYTCTVESMGNATIQPTMYFNLRNVPLFYGPYYITSVTHKITPGDFKTTFVGVRQPLYSIPTPDSLISSVNKKYIEYYKEKILSSKKVKESPKITSINPVGNASAGSVEGNQTACETTTRYTTKPFADYKTTNISETELKDLITNKITEPELRPLYYGIIKTMLLNSKNNVIWSTFNNNLYNITSTAVYTTSLTDPITNQVCVTSNILDQENDSFPYFSFNSVEESLLFYDGWRKVFLPELQKIKNSSTEVGDKKKYAFAFTLFTLFEQQQRFFNPAGVVGFYTTLPTKAEDFILRYQEKIQNKNDKNVDDYNLYFKIYEDAYDTFFS